MKPLRKPQGRSGSFVLGLASARDEAPSVIVNVSWIHRPDVVSGHLDGGFLVSAVADQVRFA